MEAFGIRNQSSHDSVVGNAPVIVSITTHGKRIESVFLAIESIGTGLLKPSRLILWLNDPQAFQNLPIELVRLKARGLEVKLSQNYGPHTKYYPALFINDKAGATLPLVTADDDILYPVDWLDSLIQAYKRYPNVINCMRARQIIFKPNGMAPYNEWPLSISDKPSYKVFGTGVSGVIYPPAMLEALRSAGEGFKAVCPKADDIWLHAVAIRNGFKIRQISPTSVHFPMIPNIQDTALNISNVHSGGNDDQIKATYSSDDLHVLGSCFDPPFEALASISPAANSPESSWVLFCAHLAQTQGSDAALMAALYVGLTHHPRSARLLYNLGVTYLRLKDHHAAQQAWQRLLALDAKHLNAHRRLAELALKQKEASLAGQHAEQALAISREANPPHGDLIDWAMLGECLLACGEWHEARTWLEQAQHIANITSPSEPLHQQVNNLYKRCQILTSRGLGDLSLDDLLTLEQALSTRHKACDWREFDTWHHVIRRLIAMAQADPTLALPRYLAWNAMHMKLSHADLQTLARAASQGIRQIQQPHDLWQPRDGLHSHPKLRIAYISSNFRNHPSSQLSHQIFRDHDRSRFTVTAYALNENDGSDLYHRIQSSVDQFVDMSHATPRTVAERIHSDEIDILVGMGSHSEGTVVDVCLWRPAAIQINYRSFNGTLGAGNAYDANLSDATSSPPSYAAWFDEELYLLPRGFYGYNNERPLLPCPSRASLGLPDRGLVLSGFNNSYKIEPETFDAWCEIMHRLPDSVLWLYTVHGEQSFFLKAAAHARGIDADRLVFCGSVYPDEHLARLACIDLHLDTFIYNGHTTMLDVLFAGTPAIARCGSTLVGRIGSSFLMELGLDDCVTHNTDDYIAKAVELANNPLRRQAIQEHLQASRYTRTPFCSKLSANRLEMAYLAIRAKKHSHICASASSV